MITCDTLIKGGSIICMDEDFRILDHHQIAIKDGKILAITPLDDPKYSAVQELDASDCLITPGFINAHTHMPMTYFRGLADDLPLDDWLQKYIWPMEARMLTPDFVYDASLHAAAEMISNGITLANDMYFHIDRIADACATAGMRVIVSEAILEHTFSAKLSQIRDSVRRIKERYQDQALVDCALAPHAIYTCSREILAECAKVAAEEGWIIHTHLSETKVERDNCLKEHGMLPLQYLHSLGFTTQRCIFAHGVWLEEEELDLLRETDCSIAICTDSNLKLSSGFAPMAQMKARGIKTLMATDGVASNNNLDILEETSTTAKLYKAWNHDPLFMPARDAFAMLTIDSAKALGMDQITGSLEPGKAADLCVINLNHLQSQPLYNPYSHLIYAISSHQVRDVLIAGKQVLKNHQLVNLDPAALIDKAKYWKTKILSEIQS